MYYSEYDDWNPSSFWSGYEELYKALKLNCDIKYSILKESDSEVYYFLDNQSRLYELSQCSLMFVVDVNSKSIDDVILLQYNQPVEFATREQTQKAIKDNLSELEWVDEEEVFDALILKCQSYVYVFKKEFE